MASSDKPPTLLGHALLGLVAQQRRSGYALQKVFRTTPMGHHRGGPGAIYPALRALESRGLITGTVRGSGSLRPTREYRISQAGRAVFKRWLRLPVTREHVIWHMDELLLRFGFMEALRAPQETLRFLNAFHDEVSRYGLELEAHYESHADSMPLHGALALRCGIEGYKALARWARDAIARFQQEHKEKKR